MRSEFSLGVAATTLFDDPDTLESQIHHGLSRPTRYPTRQIDIALARIQTSFDRGKIHTQHAGDARAEFDRNRMIPGAGVHRRHRHGLCQNFTRARENAAARGRQTNLSAVLIGRTSRETFLVHDGKLRHSPAQKTEEKEHENRDDRNPLAASHIATVGNHLRITT